MEIVWEKITELLEQCDKQKKRRDACSEADSDGRALIQADICRKFVILDWMLDLESGRDLNEEDAVIMGKFRTCINDARREAKSTVEDLEMMPFPVLGEMGATGISSAKNPVGYFYLPDEVREMILGYLAPNDPQTKLNVMEAIPCAGELMKWNKRNLQIAAACRIVMEQRELGLDTRDIYALSHVNLELRDMIKDEFEKYLRLFYTSTDFPTFFNHISRAGQHLHEDLSGQEYRGFVRLEDLRQEFRLNPIPNLFSIPKMEMDDNGDMYLAKRGSKLWEVEYFSDSDLPLITYVETMSRFLNHLPNIRALFHLESAVPAPSPSPISMEELKLRIANIQFPNLKYLTTLNCGVDFDADVRKLWEDHGETFEPADVRNTNSPAMLDAYCTLVYLSLFRSAPLTVLRLEIMEMACDRNSVPALLSLLASQFGDTLETLSISLDEYEEEDDTDRKVTSGSTFLIVKRIVASDEFRFLMLFPALEILEVYGSEGNWGVELEHKSVGLFECWERLSKSILWKLMPRLDQLRFNQWKVNGGILHASESDAVFRRDCVAFQQNAMVMPPLFRNWRRRHKKKEELGVND